MFKSMNYILLLLPLPVFAQTMLTNPTPKGGATLKEFIDLLITILQSVLIPALVVLMIYAGYQMVTAGGNEEQVTKAKMWIIWTLVGAAIILSAHVLADLIYNTMQLFN